MSAIIEMRGLTKVYRTGRGAPGTRGRLAVNELTLSIEEGTVFGFVGPNGAGKTTTMRMLTTLLAPTAGEAWVDGSSVAKDPRGVRRAIGYMPDFFGVYDDMKVWEYLDFFSACYGVPATERAGIAADLLTLVELSHRRDDMVDSLSRGMKQRLCLARTLAHDPRVLILDEPASGLDPRARVEIRELLRELRDMGKTIFLSSHILSEVADVCTHVAIIEDGCLVASGSLAEMRKRLRPRRTIRVRLLGDPAGAREALLGMEGVSSLDSLDSDGSPTGELRFEFSGGDADLSAVLGALVRQGLGVISFAEETGDLEDLFLQVTRGIVS
jgi:ABC-2 type transport system ATP-binding protein